MGSCTLEIGPRVVLRSEGGAPEAEYALFDAGCIELSALEPGTIREAAYRTTVGEAKDRLESAGVTLDLAYEATEVMRPKLAALYARGEMARRAAHLLGPAELFEGHVFDGASRRYRGHWLDVASLAADVKMLRATTAFQILHLLAILHEHDDDDPVSLLTADYTRERRPGERTLRRVLLDHTAALPDALRALDAAPKPLPTERDQGAPSRVELLDGVRTRLREGSPATFRAHVDSLERVLNVRERPDKGPLADPELWALEEQLSVGDARGVIPKVEVIERTSGRGPATTYLRARAALIAGVVDPRSIAERVAPLAESMSTFVELELLAAEAWAAAGELRRAVPYARDLASMPSLDDVLRTRARDVLARAEAAGIHTQGSSPPSAGAARSPSSPPASTRGVIPESGPPGSRREVVIRESSPADRPGPGDGAASEEASPVSKTDVTAIDVAELDRRAREAAASSIVTSLVPEPSRPSIVPNRIISVNPAPRAIPVEDMPTATSMPDDDFGNDAPTVNPPDAMAIPAAAIASMQPPSTPVDIPKLQPLRTMDAESKNLGRRVPSPAPHAFDEYGDVEGTPTAVTPPALDPAAFAAMTPPMKGGSRPPYRSSAPPAPPPGTSKAPPRMTGVVETAEHLSLPPGLHGTPPNLDELPRTVLDARVLFTHLSRQLGREYRTKYGVDLRTNVVGIEAMQSYLRDRFPEHTLSTPEDYFEIRRHGAFLSEIVARTLGAYWSDIGPSDVGYWSMQVPPKTTVWPFGRVLRFVQMGTKERDLVSYYLELESRTRR